MSTVSPIFPRLWKFVASSAASVVFVLSIIGSLQLVVSSLAGDPDFTATRNFWHAFGLASFAKLFLGLSLATLAFTEFTDRLLDRLLGVRIQSWWQHSLSYFIAFFAIILVSTASFFLAEFPIVPWTYMIAFFFLTICVSVSAIVYGVVASARI